MMAKTKIGWTDATWNPIVGCSIVSPGCTNCYAQKMAHRVKHMEDERTGKPDASHYYGTTKVVNGNPVWTGLVRQAPDHVLTAPLRWKRPRKIFVNSMSDLFHEDVPDEWIDRVFAVMQRSPRHLFQILTKRSERMREYVSNLYDVAGSNSPAWFDRGFNWPVGDVPKSEVVPFRNVWLGVSCEDQARADERIPDLLETPAARRFVSAEPLLGPIDFTDVSHESDTFSDCGGHPDPHWPRDTHDHLWIEALAGRFEAEARSPAGKRLGDIDVGVFIPPNHKIDWIIVGGESGPGHRPMQIEWAESIRQQCEAAGTPFFFKQDSAHKPGQRGRASDDLWACKAVPA